MASAKNDNIQVSVRVRPWIAREAAREHVCIVRMSGDSTEIVDERSSVITRRFTFDNSFWSFDPSDPHFVGQEQARTPLVRMRGFGS